MYKIILKWNVNYYQNSTTQELELTIKRRPCLGGILFELIESSCTECIGRNQACLPPLTLSMCDETHDVDTMTVPNPQEMPEDVLRQDYANIEYQ
ncbi:hypothetical protein V3C99_011496 [Haemonchus contortus]